MADVGLDLRILATYLSVSCGKVSMRKHGDTPCMKCNETQVRGLASIAKQLVRLSSRQELLGKTAEEKTMVNQWLEYRVTHVDRCASKLDISSVLKVLNCQLSDQVYLVGHDITVADLVMFYGLHCIVTSLEHAERQKHMNVSRWFDNMQHLPRVRQSLSEVSFLKTPIYSGRSH